MEKINIVFGDSAYGILKYVLQSNKVIEEIINFNDELSLGKINTYFSKERREYLKKLYKEFLKEEEVEKRIKLYELLKKINKEKKVIVWYSNNINEKLMLELVCTIFKGKIYTIDFSKEKSIKSVAQLSPEYVEKHIGKEKLLSETEKENYNKKYKEHLNNDKLLRINDRNLILDVDENYFDNFFREKLEGKENISMKLIGEIMGEMSLVNQQLSENFIIYRLKTILENNSN
ncbi:MAG: DUF1835 domain-containing protein [Fusobacterium sp.]